MRLSDTWKKVIMIFLWSAIAVLYIILIFQIVKKILGGSWQIEEIVLTAVTIFAGVLTMIYGQLNATVQRLSGSFEQFEKRFSRLEDRMELHLDERDH